VRIMNVDHRLHLLVGDRIIDVESASAGRFPADVQSVYDHWDDFRGWADGAASFEGRVVPDTGIGPPVPRPRQIFAIGLNYKDHAREAGLELPASPMVFTKFPAAIAGPYDTIELPPGSVDFEVELVAVIGRRARRVSEADGWDHIAGLTLGQDLSERDLQLQPPAPQQYNLAKSFAGFAPIGPWLATPDEFADPDNVELGCLLNGEQMQKAHTGELIFPIPALVAYLSGILPLLPGDLIFTGTPSGIGWGRTPQRFLQPGDDLVSYADGIGTMHHRFSRVER
jgi:2-keto-4-pentenoate hydratase/2-oxohepta-3-ene-1,7-dioic acid hydratase in catechol pathway